MQAALHKFVVSRVGGGGAATFLLVTRQPHIGSRSDFIPEVSVRLRVDKIFASMMIIANAMYSDK